MLDAGDRTIPVHCAPLTLGGLGGSRGGGPGNIYTLKRRTGVEGTWRIEERASLMRRLQERERKKQNKVNVQLTWEV